MPFRRGWVRPRLALKYRGVRVYHVYKDDEVENGPQTYWFTLDPEDGGYESGSFDVRDLGPGQPWALATAYPMPPFLHEGMEDPAHYAGDDGRWTGTDDERAEVARREALWKVYHAGEGRAILECLRAAIRAGELPPGGEETAPCLCGERSAVECKGAGCLL